MPGRPLTPWSVGAAGRADRPTPKGLMMRTLLVVVGLLTCPQLALAQSGINLFWNHCYTDGGAHHQTFACNTNIGFDALQMSVVVPADLPHFVGASISMRVTAASGQVPAWWQVWGGQCRANAVTVSFDPNQLPESGGCPSIWGGVTPLQAFQIQPGQDGTNEAFVLAALAELPTGGEAAVVADGTELLVGQVVIRHTKTVGAGACEGCSAGACFMLQEVFLQQPYPLPNYRVTRPRVTNWAFYNSSSGLRPENTYIPCEVPALNRTWGAIKSMYR